MEITMVWTKTTRAHYQREALRYASDLTDAEWRLIEPFLPRASKIWATKKDQPTIGCRGDPLHGLDRLPMARDPQGFSGIR
jgi:hypothetical protein